MCHIHFFYQRGVIMKENVAVSVYKNMAMEIKLREIKLLVANIIMAMQSNRSNETEMPVLYLQRKIRVPRCSNPSM